MVRSCSASLSSIPAPAQAPTFIFASSAGAVRSRVDRRRFRQRGVFELLHPPATTPDQERWRAPEAPAIGGPYRQASASAVWSPEARSGVGRSGPGTLGHESPFATRHSAELRPHWGKL